MNLRFHIAFLGLLVIACPTMQAATPAAFRPPAVPLVAHDPYFSIWSFADRLTDGPTKHWTGRPQPLTSLIRIDGQMFRVMGADPADVPALPQTEVRVLPTRTIYTFAGGNVQLVLTFLTPALPDDLDVLARPLTYIEWAVKSIDGKPHPVQVYFDAAAELVVNTPQQAVTWGRIEVPGLQVAKMGSKAQLVLGKPGDDLRIDWGYAYLAAEKDGGKVAIAERKAGVAAFKKDGSLPAAELPAVERGVAANAAPVLAARLDFGNVGAMPVARRVMLAYDDEFSLRYFDDKLRPYWRRNGLDAAGLLALAAKERSALTERCVKLDDALMADLTRAGGEGYAKLAALAYRQTLAGSKLVADRRGQPLFFPKENHSNGCIGTVDVIYPMAPFCLLFSPALTKAMLVPILDYAASPRWKFAYAPHDLGQYPFATGQVYGGGERSDDRQMMVEESANMILCVAALAQAEGNTSLADHYWPLLTRWAEYLQAKGFDPENQLCTDDFAGHLAHNTNLSAKAIVALGAYAQLAQKRGDMTAAKKYGQLARDFAARWEKEANDGDHFRLAFDKPGTWSQKYNLVWDRILGLKLFSAEALRKEMDFYKSHQQRYGLPLDSRKKYTKLDWTLWTASLTGRRDDFDALVAPVVAWVSATPDRTPLTDWYFTDSGKRQGFDARPVVGGLFMPLLGDAALWQKWAQAGANTKGPWAPIPIRKYVAVLPTGENSAQPWRVKFELPKATEEWIQPKFVPDESWEEKAAPFGLQGEARFPSRTRWTTLQIWLRRDFDLKEADLKEPRLRLIHTGDCEIYLNGVLALRREGRLQNYENFEIEPAALKTLHAGKNVIAVHARAGAAGVQKPMRVHLDIGIIELEQGEPKGQRGVQTNWPQFRGERAAGLGTGASLPDSWSTTENVAWKTTIPGQGWSSPVVWGNKIFVTSFVSDDKLVTAPKTGYYAPLDVKIPPGEFRWTVYCLDSRTGKIEWERVAHKGRPEHSIHVKASYAAETPSTDGERVYAYFGNVGLFCYDLDGKEHWSKKWGSFKTRLGWGTGASPLLHKGRIYVVNDNDEKSFLVALDSKTGKEIWRVDRDEKTSWATPFVWENDKRTEIVTAATGKVRSYDLDGKLLWQFGGMSSICVPTPIEAHGLLYVTSGYEFGKPRPLFAIRPGASGDISLKERATSNEFIAWSKEGAGPYHPTPLIYGDYLYVLYSRGLLSCFDAKTGKEIYGQQRLGGSFTASPWTCNGKIFCLSEEGDASVIEAGPEFKVLQKNSLDEVCLATPALAGNGLFIRTLTKLYRIERKND